MKRKLTLLVSACLLGLTSTHNGGSNFCPDLSLVQEKAVLVPVCPEQLGGLPTPRPPAEITGADGYGVLAGEAVVLTASGEDKTAAYCAVPVKPGVWLRRYQQLLCFLKHAARLVATGTFMTGVSARNCAAVREWRRRRF